MTRHCDPAGRGGYASARELLILADVALGMGDRELCEEIINEVYLEYDMYEPDDSHDDPS